MKKNFNTNKMGNCDLIIRATSQCDIPRLMEIFDIAKAFMRLNGNMSQWSDNYPSADVILRDIANSWSYVMVNRDGKITATFCLMTTPEPTYEVIKDGRWLNDNPYLTIHRIASDGSAHGILAKAVKYALKSGKDIRIDTHADNRPMHLAVKELGFKRCGIINLADGSERIAYQLVNSCNN